MFGFIIYLGAIIKSCFVHKISYGYLRNLERISEKAMAPHSSTLAWKIPWMEEPGRLQSTGSLRVGHDWETSLSLFTSCIGEGNGNPLQCSCLENPRNGGAWWAAVYGVSQSRTRLKRLSSSSSRKNIHEACWNPLIMYSCVYCSLVEESSHMLPFLFQGGSMRSQKAL